MKYTYKHESTSWLLIDNLTVMTPDKKKLEMYNIINFKKYIELKF